MDGVIAEPKSANICGDHCLNTIFLPGDYNHPGTPGKLAGQQINTMLLIEVLMVARRVVVFDQEPKFMDFKDWI